MIGTQNNAFISSVIASLTRQNEDLVKSLIQMQYYFRGAFGREDVWAMSHTERELAVEFLNERFKDAGEMMKKQIPVFI